MAFCFTMTGLSPASICRLIWAHNGKNENDEINILPYVIDYASGAGHFLTESMEEIDKYIIDIGDIGDNFFKNQKAKKEFNK
ncbi:hypothetical protein BEH94_01255 [Candidatus Altiarchaeales archaeon WOR_SM1_SCG]|nr:hypothetical protein BEH94_01255 [Candidatus Altiarchaeales archaeon WOR_SM1_SCG]